MFVIRITTEIDMLLFVLQTMLVIGGIYCVLQMGGSLYTLILGRPKSKKLKGERGRSLKKGEDHDAIMRNCPLVKCEPLTCDMDRCFMCDRKLKKPLPLRAKEKEAKDVPPELSPAHADKRLRKRIKKMRKQKKTDSIETCLFDVADKLLELQVEKARNSSLTINPSPDYVQPMTSYYPVPPAPNRNVDLENAIYRSVSEAWMKGGVTLEQAMSSISKVLSSRDWGLAAPNKTEYLGHTVRDKISGLEGIVIADTQWLYGCRRITIQPSTLHEGKPIEPHSFDAPQVEIIGEKTEPTIAPAKPGTHGPRPEPTQSHLPRK